MNVDASMVSKPLVITMAPLPLIDWMMNCVLTSVSVAPLRFVGPIMVVSGGLPSSTQVCDDASVILENIAWSRAMGTKKCVESLNPPAPRTISLPKMTVPPMMRIEYNSSPGGRSFVLEPVSD